MIKSYNWNDLPREQVRAGIERCGFRGEDVIVVMNWIEPNIAINPHQHKFEQLVLCIQGCFNYHVGNDIVLMTQGSMLRVPPNTIHYVEPIGNDISLNLDIFAPARSDYLHLVKYQDDEFGSLETRRDL
jgi:quercetin dioxygenase-like cupin family protein